MKFLRDLEAEEGKTPQALLDFPKLSVELQWAYQLFNELECERGRTSMGMAGSAPDALKLETILLYLRYAGIRNERLCREMVRRVKSLDRTRILLWSESAAKDTPT